jgi:short-subunit dehydrogenase
MGAYPAAKAALGAYTQQLRLELADQGVHVLLVCPGPIARERPRSYGAEESANLPASAHQPGAGVKARAIAPDLLARRVVSACQRRQSELVIPGKARLLFALAQLSPRLGDWLLKRLT